LTAVRKDGIAVDNEEFIDGVVAFAVPLKAHQPGLQAAIWAVGLKQQVSKRDVPNITEFVKKAAAEINLRFSRPYAR
jgi:IclR family KDG regulon transcriptional repressor